MTARDTRTGGKHAAHERGAYETVPQAKDTDAVAWLERERKKERDRWFPFREFFEKLQRQTA